MSELKTIRFDGDNLQVVREDAQVWVVLKRACEALGIDHDSQRKRLADRERCPWATTVIMTAVAEDGRNRELFCLDLDSLPMWLATIEVSRVRPEAREKLIHYQRECARVLRDHFFGRQQAAQVPDEAALGALIGRALGEQLAPLVGAVVSLSERVAALEARPAQQAIVSTQDYARIRAAVGSISKALHVAGEAKSVAAARASIHQRMRARFGWGGRCQPWNRMPLEKLPYVEAFLDELRRDADAALERVTPRQLRLVPSANDVRRAH